MEDNDIQNSNNSYDASSIKVLKGLEAVKKRPGMYIGDVSDGTGLHHMVFEVVDNAVDESLAGYCNKIIVTLNRNGSVSVRDNGRGIPVDIHQEEGISAAEVIMTQLHSGGKFDRNSYKISGGLHGVGVSVVNALSSSLKLRIFKNGSIYEAEFSNGDIVQHLLETGTTTETGTEVTFLPSKETFGENIEFSFDFLLKRFREMAFLNSGIRIVLIDKRDSSDESNCKIEEFFYEGGLKEFVKYINTDKTTVTDLIYFSNIKTVREDQDILCEVAIQWNDSYHDNTIAFTNNIRNKDGGTHLMGFRAGLTRSLNNYLNKNKNIKKKMPDINPEDMREGLSCILSVKVPEPKFSSQTKDKLVSSEVRGVVEATTSFAIEKFLEENPSQAEKITAKLVQAAIAREAARKARDFARKKNVFEVGSIPGKLSDCQEKDPALCEVFLVEGASAGGTAKQGRDRRYQAILPLKGKILNTERARTDKILSSTEVTTLMSAIGTGIEDDFNVEKVRYHKIIIMTDADVDGAHIKTLLLTFFFRKMPEIIDKGYLYLARPPLYRVKKGSNEIYLQDDEKLDDFFMENISSNYSIKTADGIVFKDRDLLDRLKKIKKYKNMITTISSTDDAEIINYLILGIKSFSSNINDIFSGDSIDLNEDFKHFIVRYICQRLNKIIILDEEKWNYTFVEDSNEVNISKVFKGIKDELKLNLDIITGHKFISLIKSSLLEDIFDILKQDGEILGKDNEQYSYNSHLVLWKNIISISSKGIAIQRFKGLGEMNADQLRDTTLDPNIRVLSRVCVSDAQAASQVFSELMGENVEPRKNFINKNALCVENLDV